MAPPSDADGFIAEIAAHLGEPYRIRRDAAFLWLTPFDDEAHARNAEQAHHALTRLGGAGLRVGGQRIPAIIFDCPEDQLAYHGLFARPEDPPEAEIIDGGCWQSWPVSHLAIPVVAWDALDAAFAHELVHAILAPEGLPIWLQEGIATEIETRMGNRDEPLADAYAWRECLAWWRSHEPAGLWDGRAFRAPESSAHAYRLAQVLAMRWTRREGGLAALRAPGAAAWEDADQVLQEMCGLDRGGLLDLVMSPPRPRGWFERLLHAVFVGDRG